MVTHATFGIERRYAASPATVFAAFSDAEKKRLWFASGGVLEHSLDFRVGGVERTRSRGTLGPGGPAVVFGNDSVYVDIAQNERIVLAYSMAVDGRRISVSLATFEFRADGAGTLLQFTEQSAFFEGSDGAAMREMGWRHLLDTLTAVLANVAN